MKKTPKTANQIVIADDILRYKKNKLASTLALLGLVFNCLYFMLLYAIPNKEFYSVQIGVSVVLTLLILLMTFLSSEGVKGYNKKFSIVLLVIAVIQIVRIFGYPLNGLLNNFLIGGDARHTIGYFGVYPVDSTFFFIMMVIYLAASAGCLIGAAVWGWIVASRLVAFQKKVDSGEVDIAAVLKEMDAEDANKAEAVAPAEVAAEPASEEVQ